LQRYLADQPVQACPPSAAYRVRKFVRRNRGTVLAASLIFVVLVAGVIGTGWGLYRAEQQRDELAGRNAALRAAHERAREAIEAVTSEPAFEQLIRERELRPEQKDFLDKMIRYYAESTHEAVATEQERPRQARAYYRMGRMNQILDRAVDSEDAYRRAAALGRQLAADFPTRLEHREQLAASLNSLGVLLCDAGRLPEAESAYDDALAVAKQLAADFPDRRGFRQTLAGVHNNLGGLFQKAGRIKEAEEAYTESLLIRKQLAADFPAGSNIHRALAMSHNNLGWLFYSTGRLQNALPAHEEAVAFQRQQVADRPDVPEFRRELAKYLLNLGNALSDSGRPGDAQTARAEALAIFKQLVAEYPNWPEFRKELANVEGANYSSSPEAGGHPQGGRRAEGDR
jgi:eukaryotic-like serine/threonine-protein kinase